MACVAITTEAEFGMLPFETKCGGSLPPLHKPVLYGSRFFRSQLAVQSSEQEGLVDYVSDICAHHSCKGSWNRGCLIISAVWWEVCSASQGQVWVSTYRVRGKQWQLTNKKSIIMEDPEPTEVSKT